MLAAVLVLAVMGADGGCRRTETDRPPGEHQVDPKRHRQVVMRVTEATGPYSVMVRAGEVGGRHMGDWTREEALVGPGYRQTLDYSSGISIEIHFLVRGHASDQFGCVIEDGPGNVYRRRGKGQVLCFLVTQR